MQIFIPAAPGFSSSTGLPPPVEAILDGLEAATPPVPLGRPCCDRSQAEVWLQSVHTDDLRLASDLQFEEFLLSAEDSTGLGTRTREKQGEPLLLFTLTQILPVAETGS